MCHVEYVPRRLAKIDPLLTFDNGLQSAAIRREPCITQLAAWRKGILDPAWGDAISVSTRLFGSTDAPPMTKACPKKLVVLVAALSGAFMLGRLSCPVESSVTLAPPLVSTVTKAPVGAPAGSVKLSRAEPETMTTPAPATRWIAALWLRKAGMVATGMALVSDQVGPQMIGFFDLTPAETATLDAAVARAAKRMAELADLHASGKEDETTGKLIVDVAAFPDEGGRVYDELLGQFRLVLGPERFAYFGTLFGDSFDQSYDGFGTHRVRYEVELKPMATPKGQPIHRIERSFVAGDGSSGRSNGQLRLDQLVKYNPVLKRFLPPVLAETTK